MTKCKECDKTPLPHINKQVPGFAGSLYWNVRDMIWCPNCGKRWDGHATACEPKQPEQPTVETVP